MRTRLVLLVAAMVAVLIPAGSASADAALIGDVDYTGYQTQMAIAANGKPMIASGRLLIGNNWANSSIDIRTCYNDDCTRLRHGSITVNSSSSFDFAVGPDGLPVFAISTWRENLTPTWVRVVKCSDAFCRGSMSTTTLFRTPSNDSSDGRSIFGISIDVDASSNPTVTYLLDTPGEARTIELVSCGDPECEAAGRTERSLGKGLTHDVAIGPKGLPVIAIAADDDDQRIAVERCRNARCTSSSRELVGSKGSGSPRIASDGVETTIVALDVKDRVERTVCDRSRCRSSERISDSGIAAGSPNVTYAKQGRSIIGYSDKVKGALWLHRCSNSCGTDTIIDSGADRIFTRVGIASVGGVAFLSFRAEAQNQIAWAFDAAY